MQAVVWMPSAMTGQLDAVFVITVAHDGMRMLHRRHVSKRWQGTQRPCGHMCGACGCRDAVQPGEASGWRLSRLTGSSAGEAQDGGKVAVQLHHRLPRKQSPKRLQGATAGDGVQCRVQVRAAVEGHGCVHVGSGERAAGSSQHAGSSVQVAGGVAHLAELEVRDHHLQALLLRRQVAQPLLRHLQVPRSADLFRSQELELVVRLVQLLPATQGGCGS
jgi:hypothetical protein